MDTSEDFFDIEKELQALLEDRPESHEESLEIQRTLKALNEELETISLSDSNDSQDEKPKEQKVTLDKPKNPEDDKVKMNKWFLDEFESHMGLKIGKSDEASKPKVSKAKKKDTLSDTESSKSSDSESTSDSDDSFSEDSLCRWFKWHTDPNRLTMASLKNWDLPKPESTQENEAKKSSEDLAMKDEDFYVPVPIPSGPMPSMPLYDEELHQFNCVELPKPPEIIKLKSEEKKPELKPKIEPKKEEKASLSDSESSSFSCSSQGENNDSDIFDFQEQTAVKRKLTYWEEMSQLPVDRGEVSQEEIAAALKESENLRKKGKNSGGRDNPSEDSEEEETFKVEDKLHDGLDFYEDSLQYPEGRANLSDLVVKEENVLQDYDLAVQQLVKLIPKIPSHHRYEIYLMLYPMIAIAYLQMVAGDRLTKAISCLERAVDCLDESYLPRLSKLRDICRAEDVPHKARKLLAGYEKLEFHMSKEAFRQLIFSVEDWPRGQQEKLLTHFHIRGHKKKSRPKQRPVVGQPLLEIIFWAAPEPLHKKDFTARPLIRGRRRRKNEPQSHRSVHLPPLERVFTPIPKRMDLLHRKTDEYHRVRLDRDHLPSTFLYTTPVCDEVVLCASFSESNSMLALGTVSSTIQIFSLKPSKLVQLKAAHWLKVLDTGMAGIDKGMLDPTKKCSRRTLYGHQGPVYGCSFNPEDRFLLSCSEDFSVRLWCLLSWSCVVIYQGHLAPVCCVVFAPLGYYFATASDDCMARIWVQDSKKPARILQGHLAEVGTCLFHPNRNYLATGSADCTVRLWDVVKGAQVRLFSGHKGRITALKFSICGRHLISGGADKFIIIWDTASERMVRCLHHHKSTINSMELAVENNLLVVAGQDCLLTIWDFERLIKDYVQGKTSKKKKSENEKNRLRSKDLLINSFMSTGAPIYQIRFTRRNLLLAYCAASKDFKKVDPNSKKIKTMEPTKKERREWLEFLDAMKMKAFYNPKNKIKLNFPKVKKGKKKNSKKKKKKNSKNKKNKKKK